MALERDWWTGVLIDNTEIMFAMNCEMLNKLDANYRTAVWRFGTQATLQLSVLWGGRRKWDIVERVTLFTKFSPQVEFGLVLW